MTEVYLNTAVWSGLRGMTANVFVERFPGATYFPQFVAAFFGIAKHLPPFSLCVLTVYCPSSGVLSPRLFISLQDVSEKI